jgi:hypothetical protein
MLGNQCKPINIITNVLEYVRNINYKIIIMINTKALYTELHTTRPNVTDVT